MHHIFFLASNRARNVRFYMKQICSSRRSCTKLSTFLTDNTIPAAPHNGVGQRCVCALQTTCCDRISCRRQSVSSINRRLCNVCESAGVERSTVGRWVIRVTACETGKAELCHLPSSGVLSKPLVLQCGGVMMP
jgi:hypothetical protein